MVQADSAGLRQAFILILDAITDQIQDLPEARRVACTISGTSRRHFIQQLQSFFNLPATRRFLMLLPKHSLRFELSVSHSSIFPASILEKIKDVIDYS